MTASDDDNAPFDRRIMKYQLGNALLISASLCGLVVGARAETHREVIVTIPYEFVAGGRTLPAGTYTVSRLSNDRITGLSIASYEQHAGVLVLTNQFESRPGDDAKVRFELRRDSDRGYK